jgi:hypothetical protein
METTKKTPWLGYVILAIIVIFTFKMCSSCGKEDDSSSYEFKPVSGIGYKLIKENKNKGDIGTPWEEYTYRSYAYEITNFEKNNMYCWQDLEALGESVSSKNDNEEKLMTTMVYFFIPSDTLKLENERWDITWNEFQDSLWIGNFISVVPNNHKSLIKGTYYK